MNRRARVAVAAIVALSATIAWPAAESGAVHAAHPGGNGRIAFVAYDSIDASSDIFSVEPDGSDLFQVTDLPFDPLFPEWSPDGQRIVFGSRSANHDGCLFGDLWVVNADGSGLTQVTDTADAYEYDASWSPDGARLVFTQDNQTGLCSHDMDIVVMDADGTNRVTIVDDTGPETWMDVEPAWSPIGDRIAFVSDRPKDDNGNLLRQVYTVAPDGTGVDQLTSNDFPNVHEGTQPSWSPDGQQIAFQRFDAFVLTWEIWAMNADGSNQHAVTSGADHNHPAWSPDGSRIAYRTNEPDGSGSHIHTIDVDGTDERVVVDTLPNPDQPTWQPIVADPPVDDLVIDDCDDPALASLTTVAGDLIAYDLEDCDAIELPNLTEVGGSLEVSGNSSAEAIDMGSLASVGGSLEVSGNSSAEAIDMSSLVVVGDLALDLSHPEVSGTTAGGSTDISMSGPTATMRVTLPDGTFETPVGFSIVGIGADELGPHQATISDGSSATIQLVEGYTFEFDVPHLGVAATLSFEVDVAALDPSTRDTLLAALAAGNTTLATRGDAEGSGYQAFAVCDVGESPTVDGCVLVESLDEFGQSTAGEPAVVRFSSVVGHFSSWGVEIVEAVPIDSVPPVVDTTLDVVAEATGADGATVSYTVPAAVDAVDGAVVVECSPISGSTFPFGANTVECSAADAAGNRATTSFEVIIADTTAPSISVPAGVTATETGSSGAAVTFEATTSDAVDGVGVAICAPSSGSTFPLGMTTVSCSATDQAGNASEPATFVVSVEPPTDVLEAPMVSVTTGWGAATVKWQPAPGDTAAISGYLVTAIAGGRVVASVTVGPEITDHTFGRLANGVRHTFVVTARSSAASGPAGSAVARPALPHRYQKIDVRVACPSFVAHNPNPYPVYVWWAATRGAAGEIAIPAGATTPLAPAWRANAIVVVAGLFRVQDIARGAC